MESQLVFMYILPEHIWAQHDTPEGATAFEPADDRQRAVQVEGVPPTENIALDAVKDHPLTPPNMERYCLPDFR